jgi:hypothetical protein
MPLSGLKYKWHSQKKIILKAYIISRLFPTPKYQRHCRNDGHKILRHWHAQEISRKDLVNYIKYRGVSLTEQGKLAAKWLLENTDFGSFLGGKIRFLGMRYMKLQNREHIKSEKLINKLDDF